MLKACDAESMSFPPFPLSNPHRPSDHIRQ